MYLFVGVHQFRACASYFPIFVLILPLLGLCFRISLKESLKAFHEFYFTDCNPVKSQHDLPHVESEEERNAVEEASVADNRKFLALICHELLNPIHAASDRLELLTRSPDSLERCEWLSDIKQSLHAMNRVLQDLTHLEAIKEGTKRFREDLVNVRQLLQEITSDCRRKQGTCGVGYKMDVSQSIPEAIVADKTVFSNIIRKFVEISTLRLRMSARDDSSNICDKESLVRLRVHVANVTVSSQPTNLCGTSPMKYLIVSVVDQGKVMTKHEREKLLETCTLEWACGEEVANIGLWLHQQFATAMKGDLGIESHIQTKFWFSIPLRLATRTQGSSPPRQTIYGPNSSHSLPTRINMTLLSNRVAGQRSSTSEPPRHETSLSEPPQHETSQSEPPRHETSPSESPQYETTAPEPPQRIALLGDPITSIRQSSGDISLSRVLSLPRELSLTSTTQSGSSQTSPQTSSQTSPQISSQTSPQISSQTSPQTSRQTSQQTSQQNSPQLRSPQPSYQPTTLPSTKPSSQTTSDQTSSLRRPSATQCPISQSHSITSNDHSPCDTDSPNRPTSSRNACEIKILIAEDANISGKIITRMLKDFDVCWVRDGLQAVQKFRNSDFDVVLMDVNMPIMDGLTATKKILELNSNVCVIGITANTAYDDLQTCLSVGMKETVPKPFQKDQIVAAIRKYVT